MPTSQCSIRNVIRCANLRCAIVSSKLCRVLVSSRIDTTSIRQTLFRVKDFDPVPCADYRNAKALYAN